MKIFTISLGCPKNLTDTEVILGKLCQAGYTLTNSKKHADVLLVNTCAFISDAKEEAIETILELAKGKKKNQKLIVAGCLPQRYKNLTKLLPEVDGFIGSGSIDKIVELVRSVSQFKKPKILVSKNSSCLFDHEIPRLKLTPPYTAYVKIADGCNNRCGYCAVPKIRGKYKSRPIESILKEVEQLAGAGVKEIIPVAQDTTYYGKDLYGKYMFAALLKKMAKIKGIEWIRIMYAHPAHVTDELIDLIAKEDKICKYLDLPIQHICDRILRSMRRGVAGQEITDLIAKIRRRVPGIAIRTSVIVGYPGEKEADFRELIDFIIKTRFERLGIFVYSKEEGTPAGKLGGQVPEKVKLARFEKIYKTQSQISRELGRKMIGKVIKVLVEEKNSRCSHGRTFMDAPDIDGSIKIKNKRLTPGEQIKVKVTRASTFDLQGILHS
ncbi:MAG: 30S ribosomal protein S12 methylthiotransferase RimO [Candidatus Saganbacteria bacterium]|nr:30S ribosomal protein S12 methylthiotransferase RimO [Candidatus Saganbacteria bacterium]